MLCAFVTYSIKLLFFGKKRQIGKKRTPTDERNGVTKLVLDDDYSKRQTEHREEKTTDEITP